MRKLSPEEYKKVLLSILTRIDSICRENGLKYMLAYGTLLGAVRHKGFIPWDDDIDLLLPRKDYETLRSVAKSFNTKEWKLLSYSNEPRFLLPFMKYCNKHTIVTPPRFNTGFVYGLSIDIFPLDYAPNNDYLRKKQANKFKIFT